MARLWFSALLLGAAAAPAWAEHPQTPLVPAAVGSEALVALPTGESAAPASFARARDRALRPLPGDAQAEAAARTLLAALGAKASATPEPSFDPARTAPRASALGVPAAPAAPRRRTRFSIPDDDPASAAARSIAQRVASFPNFRVQVPGAVWLEDDKARFAVRSSEACLRALGRAGVRAHALNRELTTPVATPVVLDGPVGGVAFVSLHEDRAVELSCELAVRLVPLARILRKHGVRAVGVNSSYRDHPKVSFHSFGLALDLMAFQTRDRTLIVADHFEVDADHHTCEGTPERAEGKALLALICALADSRLFSSILTPNYNEGHRDHVHLDLRPDDPRLFVR